MTTETLILAALLAAGPTEDIPPFTLDITVEAAEAIEQPLDDTATSATVLGPAEIRARGVNQVADLLRGVAGVDVIRTGTRGKATSVRMGGGTAAQTLVLLDGVELNSPTLGSADLSDLTLDDVERVEVVRGPMSALYGSNAMGGVINIVTRRGRGAPLVEAELEGGAYGELSGAVRSRGSLGERAGYTLALSRTTLDGRRITGLAGSVDNDSYENTTLVGGLDLTLAEGTTLGLGVRYLEGKRELPLELFGAQGLDVNSSQDDRQAILSAQLRSQVTERVSTFVRFGMTDARQELDDPLDPGESGPFASDFSAQIDTRLTEIAAGVDVEMFAGSRLLVGLEHEAREGENRDSFSGGVPNFDDSIGTTSLFAQNRLQLESALTDGDDLVLTAGVRVDDHETADTAVNPKLAVRWRAPMGLRLRFGAARGFRAPSLNELLFPFFGNPDLEPEVARSYEVGVGGRFAGDRVDAELRVFRSDWDDLITTDPTTFTAVNLEAAEVTGAELEVRARATDELWLRGSYTYQDATDASSGDWLLRRPRHKAALSFVWERPRQLRLAVDVLAVGEQRDVIIAGFPEVNPGWTRVDLAGAWTPAVAGRRIELYSRLENLFDEEYSEITGSPAPGVHGRFGVRLRLP